MYLFFRSHEGDSVDVSHDCSLDNFSRNVAVNKGRCWKTFGGVFCDHLFYEFSNTSINILRPVGGFKVDLASTSIVTTQGCVMLKSITRSILVNWKLRYKPSRIG